MRRKKEDKNKELYILAIAGILTIILTFSILSYYEKTSYDQKIKESIGYWMEMNPLAVLDIQIHNSSGNITVQNFNSRPVLLKSIILGSAIAWNNETTLDPGEKKTLPISIKYLNCKKGTILKFYKVYIKYDTNIETGEKALITRCQ